MGSRGPDGRGESKTSGGLIGRYDFATNNFRISGDLEGVKKALKAPALIPRSSDRRMVLDHGTRPLYAADPVDPSAIRVRAGVIDFLASGDFQIRPDEELGPLNPTFDRVPEKFPGPGPGMPADLVPLAKFVASVHHGTIRHDGNYDFLFRLAAAWDDLRILIVAPDEESAEQATWGLEFAKTRRGGRDRNRIRVTTPSGEGVCATPILGNRHAVFFLDRDTAIPDFFIDTYQGLLADLLFQEIGKAKFFGLCRHHEEENPLDKALRWATFGTSHFDATPAAAKRVPPDQPPRLNFPGLYASPKPKWTRPRRPTPIWSGAEFRPPTVPVATFEEIVTQRNLLEALLRIQQDKGDTAGPDEIRPDRIGIAEAIEISRSQVELLRRSKWRPGPSRKIPIPKADGGTRTICVANIADRMVSACLAHGLREFADAKQADNSHGWRPGRSHLSLLRSLAAEFRSRDGGLLVVDDVRRCFDGVSQHAVQEAVEKLLPDDQKLRRLVVSCARGVRRAGEVGIDQGSALSPMVMNLVLSGLLEEAPDATAGSRHFLFAHDESAPAHVRYADNLLAIAKDQEEAERIREGWARALAKAGMTLKGGLGNGIFEPTIEEVEALGFRIRAEDGELHFGISRCALQKLKQALMALKEGMPGTVRAQEILRGWLAAYAPMISPGRDRDEACEGIIGALHAATTDRDRRALCTELILEKLSARDREPEDTDDEACARSAADRPPPLSTRTDKARECRTGEGAARHRTQRQRKIRWGLDPAELDEAIPASEAWSWECSESTAVLPPPTIFINLINRESEQAQAPTAERGKIAHLIDETEQPRPKDKMTFAAPAAPSPTAGSNLVDQQDRRGASPKATPMVFPHRQHACRWPAATHPSRSRADPVRPDGQIHTSIPAAIGPRGSPASAREEAHSVSSEQLESGRGPSRSSPSCPPPCPGGQRAAIDASPTGPPVHNVGSDRPFPRAGTRSRAVAPRQPPAGRSRSSCGAPLERLPPPIHRGPSRAGEGVALARPPPGHNERSQHARSDSHRLAIPSPRPVPTGDESSARCEIGRVAGEVAATGAATGIVRAVASHPLRVCVSAGAAGPGEMRHFDRWTRKGGVAPHVRGPPGLRLGMADPRLHHSHSSSRRGRPQKWDGTGGQGKQVFGRRRGGFVTKIRGAVSGLELSARIILTPDQAANVTHAIELIKGLPAAVVIGDKWDDSRAAIKSRGHGR